MAWARYTFGKNAAMAILVAAVAADVGLADALVVTRAMQASTIAEIFIERELVRVEIEVGAADAAAFENVLPNELYEQITGQAKPFDERLVAFLESDWVMQADGKRMRGKLERIAPAKRVVRDEVTGDALSIQPTTSETVIRLSLHYEWDDRPQSMTMRPPLKGNEATANIGFVCYHKGLPVNDFRYLSEAVTLDLDWDDPWYSRFRHRNLRRQFDAPMSVYLYIEPYEVRKEIIIRPKDLQSWLDLGLPDDGVISVAQQETLKERVAKFLSTKNPVTIDGQLIEGRLERIHFIHRTLRTTGIVEPPVDLDTTSATLGVIYVFPIEQLPDEVQMEWQLFSPKLQSIPAVASDEAGGLPSQLTSRDPVMTWKNYLTNPSSHQMLSIAPPPPNPQFAIPLVSIFFGAVSFITFTVMSRRWSMGLGLSRFALIMSIAAMGIAAVLLPVARVTITNPFEKPRTLAKQETKGILESLLHNVYRSFDHHDEQLIYDRLAHSISGELLAEVYLETRASMEIKNQGGLRISVKEVTVTDLETLNSNVTEPTFRCRWRVSGWIGHWGHIHRRENEHVARITISPRDKLWKITAMEMLDEQPVERSQELGRQQDTAA